MIDSAEPGLCDSEYGHRLALLRAKQAACPDRPLLFALGSSRTLYGFRPDALGKSADGALAFNFGGLGAGPLVERMFLDRLLAVSMISNKVFSTIRVRLRALRDLFRVH
jgi:hypothetical protein